MPEIKFLGDIEFHKLAKAGKTEGIGVRKYFIVEEKEISDEERIIEFTNSTPTEDRYHDTIDQSGWKLDNFRKNPVVLWAHDYSNPPVAKSVNVWVEEGKLKSRDQFTPRDLYPFGFMVYELYKNGFLNAKSVGFQPITYAFNDETDGVEFYTQELLEHSCVPVPANPEALVSAKSMGIDLLPLKTWAEEVLDTWNEEKGIWIPRKDIETVFSLLNGKTYSTPKSEEKNSETKSEEPGNKTTTKPEGGGWDETDESWRYRVRDPEDFIQDSFRTKEIDTGVKAVFGKLKADGEDGPMKTQTIIFDKEAFPKKSDAEAWLKEHEDLAKEADIIFIKYVGSWNENKISNELMGVCQELNIEGLTIDRMTPQELIRLIKEEIIHIKSGRVLSEKNRNLIQTCVSQMQEAIEALHQLLDATEPQDDTDSKIFTLDDEEPVEQKSTESTLTDEEIDLDSFATEEKTSPNPPSIDINDAKEIIRQTVKEEMRKLTGKLD